MKTYHEDIYDLCDSFINSDFTDKLITFHLREAIGMTRLSIDSLEKLNFTQGGLDKHHREDLENDWEYLEALTKTYIYFSGDYDLKALPVWHQDNDDEEEYTEEGAITSFENIVDDWAYWSPEGVYQDLKNRKNKG